MKRGEPFGLTSLTALELTVALTTFLAFAALLATFAALLAALLALATTPFLSTTLTARSLLTATLLTATLILFTIVCHDSSSPCSKFLLLRNCKSEKQPST
jgi:hypothetical protein